MSHEYHFEGTSSVDDPNMRRMKFAANGLQTHDGTSWVYTASMPTADYATLGVIDCDQAKTDDDDMIGCCSNAEDLQDEIAEGEFGYLYDGPPVPGEHIGFPSFPAGSQQVAVDTSAIAAAVQAALSGSRITVQSSVLSDGTIELVQGDDYSSSDSRTIRLTITNYSGPSLVGGTFDLGLTTAALYNAGETGSVLTLTGSGEMSGANAVFDFQATAAQTQELEQYPPDEPLNHIYQVRMTKSGRKITLLLGATTVKRSVL
jgi:hypothetical protein